MEIEIAWLQQAYFISIKHFIENSSVLIQFASFYPPIKYFDLNKVVDFPNIKFLFDKLKKKRVIYKLIYFDFFKKKSNYNNYPKKQNQKNTMKKFNLSNSVSRIKLSEIKLKKILGI